MCRIVIDASICVVGIDAGMLSDSSRDIFFAVENQTEVDNLIFWTQYVIEYIKFLEGSGGAASDAFSPLSKIRNLRVSMDDINSPMSTSSPGTSG